MMSMTAVAAELDGDYSSGNVVISTVVPSVHTFTVNADGADVFVNGTGVKGSADLERQSTPTLLIRADSGRLLQTVLLDGKDVTSELKNGMLKLPKVLTQHTLTVTTQEETNTTDLIYTVIGTVFQNGKPISGITMELRSELKTVVTGSDGTFRFDNVGSGHHSLTALMDGKAVGYAELTLTSSSTVVNVTVADNGMVNISVPEHTAIVNIVLNLTDDSVLQVTDVQATNGTKPGNAPSPQTGDTGNMVLWISLLLISCGVVTVLGTTRQRRKAKNMIR